MTSNFVLEELPSGLFKFNPQLKKLNFAKNNIKSLFSNTLEGLKNLEEILIGNNPIIDIPNGFFSKAENLRQRNQETSMQSNVRKWRGVVEKYEVVSSRQKINKDVLATSLSDTIICIFEPEFGAANLIFCR